MTSTANALGYTEWNQRIADAFFRPELKGHPVYLAVDLETLREIGEEQDDLAIAALAEAESRGCPTVQALALNLFDEWRRDLDFDACHDAPVPPFIAILALFVLAVNHGGTEWKAHAYYDRLHDLLGEPEKRISSLEPSAPQWSALETWSVRCKRGALGVFRAQFVGMQPWVGLPRRQILLAPRERRALFRAFLRARLTPDSDPSDRQLHHAVRGAKGLLTRTQRLLSRWPADDAARDLLEEIRYRLESWDMEPIEAEGEAERVELPLRLLLATRGRAFTDARFVTSLVPGLTDTGQHLVAHETPGLRGVGARFELDAGDSASGRPVILDHQGDPKWAARVSWFDDISLEFEGSPVAVARTGAPQRVLDRGARRGLFEEVEPSDLNPGREYLLLSDADAHDRTPEFVGEFLGQWAECGLGTSVRFRPFRAANQVGRGEPHPRIRLVGGIPSEAGRRSFLSFGPPTIAVGLPGSIAADLEVEVVAFNADGHRVRASIELTNSAEPHGDDADLWSGGQTENKQFKIVELSDACARCDARVRAGGFEVSRTFYVDREPLSGQFVEPLPRDALGLPTEVDSAVFRGLDVRGPQPVADDRLPIASRPIKCVDSDADDLGAQRAMQLMRTRHRLSWSNAKRLLMGCLPQDDLSHAGARYLVHELQTLHALGVIELEEHVGGGIASVAELPPGIAVLPRLANRAYDPSRGPWTAYQAVPVGCWLPEQLGQLKRAARKEGIDLYIDERQQAEGLTPLGRVLLTTGEMSMKRFRALAERLAVDFHGPAPLASRFAAAIAPIDSISESPDWIAGRPADSFMRRFFDPRALGVTEQPLTHGDRFELWECRYPDRPVWRFFIVDREENRRIEIADRQLARWYVRLKAHPDAPIPVTGSAVLVPLELRLPPLLERMLVLGSGHAPELRRYLKHASPFTSGRVSERFGIPHPPEASLDWLSFRRDCTGNFCYYRGAYRTHAWPAGGRMPMLGVSAEQVSYLGLEG